jgi:hemolysin activation/secretion protein
MARASHFGCLGVLAVCMPAAAQQIPDAGALRQQIETSQPVPGASLPKTGPAAVPKADAPAPAGSAATVVAKAFRFAGNTRFAPSELEAVLAGYLNRPLDFNALQAAAAQVARHYRRQGWVVRTYLPKQDVTEGTISIHVVEAVFGQPEFEGTRPQGIVLETVRDRIARHVPGGEPLNLDRLDRTLLLIDDLPGVRVSGRLEPGRAERETNVVLSVEDDPWLDGVAGIDNGGSRSTGALRATGVAGFNSLLSRGELLQAQAMVSEGTAFVRFTWQQPVGLSEWRAGANVSYLRYRLVGEDFEALDARGHSTGFGFEASYPLLRSRPQNLFLGVAVDRKRFDNTVGSATTSRYSVDALSATLNGNRLDDPWVGGTSQGQVAAVLGRVDLGGSPNAAADAATTRTDGAFVKLRFSAQNERLLASRQQLGLSLSGQVGNKNLDSSERFYLGGPSGVRAYPVSEGGGSDGVLGSAELRWLLPERLTAAGFVDWGMVRVNHDNDFAGAALDNTVALSGIGASIAWQGPRRLNGRFVWAHRIGHNPNAGSTGKDQDGSLVKHRFWLSVHMPFEI